MAKASWDSRDTDTQEHKEIVETGKAATAAGRLKAGASSAMVDVSSNFGRVKNEHTRSADRSEKRNTLLQFIDEAVGSANSVVRDHDLQLAVVHRNPMSMVLSHVAKSSRRRARCAIARDGPCMQGGRLEREFPEERSQAEGKGVHRAIFIEQS